MRHWSSPTDEGEAPSGTLPWLARHSWHPFCLALGVHFASWTVPSHFVGRLLSCILPAAALLLLGMFKALIALR